MTELSGNGLRRLKKLEYGSVSEPPGAHKKNTSFQTHNDFSLVELPEHRRVLLDGSKRAIDLSVAIVLILLLAPVIPIIGLLIKLTSRGPVLYTQVRHGRYGKPFMIMKFRTMYCCDPADGSFCQATRNDPRITAVGRILRTTSLDELPQLFNVVKGDMSLVGPRPHAVQHDILFADQIEDYWERYDVLPGITGWAQIHGLRGETQTIDIMRQRVALDLWYVRNRSILLDMKILLLTPKVTIGGTAY